MRIAFATVAGLLLMCCGCATAEPATVAPVGAPPAANCIETEATPASARPAVLATSTNLWFGTDDLWVGLPDHAPAVQGDKLVLKFPWVTLRGDDPTPDMGLPQVSATRAGAATPVPASFGVYSQTYGSGKLSFWPATIEFPEAGCWTVTGALGDTTVQFVVKVTGP
jgi:hypothetical protein